ncbi:hypothetical protein [Deinococcus sp. RM]|uniref:hypothetical protein n=1 Tax=Deinococcus sp. RM TaxID=2316359 RepID=UPI000E67E753|nr:hypothetical protein D3W47_10250 [Deinococcus sp. RM]
MHRKPSQPAGCTVRPACTRQNRPDAAAHRLPYLPPPRPANRTKLLLAGLLLTACQPVDTALKKARGELMTSRQLNAHILARLTQADFTEIDPARLYAPGGRPFLTKRSRAEAVGILDGLIQNQVQSTRWADDYGQVHGTFRVKAEPRMMLGLSASFIKGKELTYENEKGLYDTYETEVLYSAPEPWDGP